MADVFKEALEQFKARQLTIDNYHKALAAERKLADQEWKAAEQQAKKAEANAEKARLQAERQCVGMEEAAKLFMHVVMGTFKVVVKVIVVAKAA